MTTADLPLIDEHSVIVDTEQGHAWSALQRTLWRLMAAKPWAAMAARLGARDRNASGLPLVEGSSLPGFLVSTVQAPAKLSLRGEHRFARYELAFHVEAVDRKRSRIGAVTRAAFPGLSGRLYRTIVIRTRGHVIGVRLVLRSVKRRAERGE